MSASCEAKAMGQADQHKRFLGHFLQNRDDILAFIQAMVRDRPLAEDLFQETSIVVWEKFSTYREGTSFAAWARKVAYYSVLATRRDFARGPGLLPLEAAEEVLHAFDRAEERADQGEWRAALRGCLEKLSTSARRVVELRYLKDLPLQAVASTLARTQAGVNSALRKARLALEKCLRRKLHGEAQ